MDDVPMKLGDTVPLQGGVTSIGSVSHRFGNIYLCRVTAEELVAPDGDRMSVKDLLRRIRFLEHQVEKLTGAINILEAREDDGTAGP